MGSLRKIVGESIGLEDELGGHWEIYPDGLSQVPCGKPDEGLRDYGLKVIIEQGCRFVTYTSSETIHHRWYQAGSKYW